MFLIAVVVAQRDLHATSGPKKNATDLTTHRLVSMRVPIGSVA